MKRTHGAEGTAKRTYGGEDTRWKGRTVERRHGGEHTRRRAHRAYGGEHAVENIRWRTHGAEQTVESARSKAHGGEHMVESTWWRAHSGEQRRAYTGDYFDTKDCSRWHIVRSFFYVIPLIPKTDIISVGSPVTAPDNTGFFIII